MDASRGTPDDRISSNSRSCSTRYCSTSPPGRCSLADGCVAPAAGPEHRGSTNATTRNGRRPTNLDQGSMMAGGTTEAEAPTWTTEPFILGTPEQFQRLREWLVEVGFTEEGLSASGGIWLTYDPPAEPQPEPAARAPEPLDARQLLRKLFLEGDALPRQTVETVLSSAERSILDDLGLLQPALADRNKCVAPIALYPSEGVYIASDRHGALEVRGVGCPADVVYSALTPETHRFMRLMPRTPCGDYLELCSGTGVAALIGAASFARHSWAVDVTERATRFAEFNTRLNALENVTV